MPDKWDSFRWRSPGFLKRLHEYEQVHPRRYKAMVSLVLGGLASIATVLFGGLMIYLNTDAPPDLKSAGEIKDYFEKAAAIVFFWMGAGGPKIVVAYVRGNAWTTLIWVIAGPVVVSTAVRFVLQGWEIFQKARLADRIGIKAYFPREGDDGRSHSWDICRTAITSSKTTFINIMGASGADTFGSEKAPLHKVISECRGIDIQILLLDPKSPELETRARSVAGSESARAESAERYRADLLTSLRFIKAKHETGDGDIEVRFYDRLPGWKNVITDRFLWLQHYADRQHVDHTDALIFGYVESRASLYEAFLSEFHRQWRRAEIVREIGGVKRDLVVDLTKSIEEMRTLYFS